MAGARTKQRHSNSIDVESEAILFQGASISQLARIFRMDNRTVSSKLHGLAPAGQRAGYDYYAVNEAAPYLCDPLLDMDDIEKLADYIRKLNPQNLPKMLTKEFWSAMLNKQKYEEQAGELWRTERVLEVFGDLVKTVRTPLILARDTIANQSELTPRQQTILAGIIDGILEELHDAVVERFSEESEQPAVEDEDEL